jgi:Carboxypeptidase regulatory-like domain/TonB dependent receptor
MRFQVPLLSRIIAPFVIVLVIMSHCWSQTLTSDLLGSVKDSSGSVVPHASLVATNTETNISYAAQTDESGSYIFTQLRPGPYVLVVEHPGFQKLTLSNIILAIDQRARQDVTLQVGQLAEQITVGATAIMLESEKATLGQVIGEKRIEEMPLNGRNFMQLAQLSAGVTPLQSGMTSPATSYTGRTDNVLAVAGSRETDTSYLLDGVETRNSWWGSVGVRPSIEAIQEFKIERNTFDAQFGFAASIVNTTIKSGTNLTHGSLFEYFRNNHLDARNFFDYGTALHAPKPPFQQNQFGGSFGGAAIKDKLFYFMNYEGFRQRLSTTGQALFPTASQLNGNFAGGKTINDPNTGSPFPGNIIPSSRFSTVAMNYRAFFPTPDCTVCGGNDYAGVTKKPSNYDQTNERVDYSAGLRDTFFFRYLWNNESVYVPLLAPASGTSFPESAQNAAAHWLHVFSPTVTNEVLLGWSQSKTGQIRDGAFAQTNVATSVLGLQNIPDRPSGWGLPSTSFSGYTGLGAGQTQFDNDKLFQVSDSLQMIRGRHILKMGVEFRHEMFYLDQDSRIPSITFTGTFTNNAIADYMLGLVQTARIAYGDPSGNFHQTLQAYHLQDDFKVNNRLTLNLGARYEYGSPATEIHGKSAFFDTSPIPQLGANANEFVGQWVTHAQVPFMPASLTYPDRTNWSPRVGLAWRPVGEKLSIRAGFGIYWLFADMNQEFQKILNPPYYPTVVYGPVSTPILHLDNLFLPPTPDLQGSLFGSTKQPNERRPYMEQYSFTAEYLLKPTLVIEVGYTGSEGHKLPQRLNMNAGTPDPTGTIPLAQRVQFPQYSSGVAASLDLGNSNYNALTARLEKRLSNGLSLLSSFTYAKCLDYGITDEYLTNPVVNTRANRGQCTTDIRLRWVSSYIYELPFGRGKKYLSHLSALPNAVLGSWEVSGITTFQSGPFISPADLVSPNLGSYINFRPNRVGPVNNADLRDAIRSNPVTGPYFNIHDIVNPVGNVYGNAARDFIQCPGLENWDISLFKIFAIHERIKVQFRTDFFNAFNHAQFGPPNTTAGSGAVGQISSTTQAPRDIQLSLKVVF